MTRRIGIIYNNEPYLSIHSVLSSLTSNPSNRIIQFLISQYSASIMLLYFCIYTGVTDEQSMSGGIYARLLRILLSIFFYDFFFNLEEKSIRHFHLRGVHLPGVSRHQMELIRANRRHQKTSGIMSGLHYMTSRHQCG